MKVVTLWRYPVKSMQGETVEAVDIGMNGVERDRSWGVVDRETGKVLSAKRWPLLLHATAKIAGDDVCITLPDGVTITAGDSSADAALSAWLERDVFLAPPPEDAGVPYELTTDPTDDASDVWDFATPPGSFVDLAAVHLLTTASLAAATHAYPEGNWAVHRFRPTALVEADGSGYLEDAWIGGIVRLGSAVVEPFMATPRCAMPTRAQPAHGLARDTGIAATVRDEHANNLGVYASVRRPGPVAVGDPVDAGPAPST
jgi:uncharacterized protein YcbX